MKFLKISAVFVAIFTLLCTFVGAQQLPGPIPVPSPEVSDHYSWAAPLADIMSYARQSVMWVSAYTQAKTVLNSSAHRWIEFEFQSPRSDGVVLAEDINSALATNKLDLIIAESENSFGGNIDLADSSYNTLFRGQFWVYTQDGGDVSVAVTYTLVATEIDLPVPSDLSYVKVTYRDAQYQEMTGYFYAQNGWLRVPTNLGNIGTAKASFNDGSQINFSLANGMAESEKNVKVTLKGEFANTYTFATGETAIVLGVQRWMLDAQRQYTAIFEPSGADVLLYAETPQKMAAYSVRIRQLPNGVWSDPYSIVSGKAFGLNLYDVLGSFPTTLGAWEAVFSFPYYSSYNGGEY